MGGIWHHITIVQILSVVQLGGVADGCDSWLWLELWLTGCDSVVTYTGHAKFFGSLVNADRESVWASYPLILLRELASIIEVRINEGFHTNRRRCRWYTDGHLAGIVCGQCWTWNMKCCHLWVTILDIFIQLRRLWAFRAQPPASWCCPCELACTTCLICRDLLPDIHTSYPVMCAEWISTPNSVSEAAVKLYE